MCPPVSRETEKALNSLHITTLRLRGRPCAQIVPKVYLRTGDTSAAATKPETTHEEAGLQFDRQHDYHAILLMSFKRKYDMMHVTVTTMSRLCLVLLLPSSCQTSYTRGMRLGLSKICKPWQYCGRNLKKDSSVRNGQNGQNGQSNLILAEPLCAAQPHIALGPLTGQNKLMDSWIQDTNCIPGDPTVALQAHRLIGWACVMPKLPAMRLDASSLPRMLCLLV